LPGRERRAAAGAAQRQGLPARAAVTRVRRILVFAGGASGHGAGSCFACNGARRQIRQRRRGAVNACGVAPTARRTAAARARLQNPAPGRGNRSRGGAAHEKQNSELWPSVIRQRNFITQIRFFGNAWTARGIGMLMRKHRAAPKFSRTPSGGQAKPGLGALMRKRRAALQRLAALEPANSPAPSLQTPRLAHVGPLRARPAAFSGQFLDRPIAFETPVPHAVVMAKGRRTGGWVHPSYPSFPGSDLAASRRVFANVQAGAVAATDFMGNTTW